MRRIAPLAARATSKFAEIRRCEILANADSAGGGAADEVDPLHPCSKRMLVCAGGFLFLTPAGQIRCGRSLARLSKHKQL
jgi:hypothetical protein